MLGFKAFVAKSRELTTKLELSPAAPTAPLASTAPSAPPDASSASASGSSEGDAFLRLKQAQMDRVLARHHALVSSGDALAATLAQTRGRLLDEAESAQFLAQSFHLVAQVRQQLGHLRGLVLKIAEDAEDVENLLAQRTEEYMAKQNAEFAARQARCRGLLRQEELERFEQQILREKEGRTRALLEERRQRLAQAFHNDLRTYQTLVTDQDAPAASALAEVTEPAESVQETLESIDLVVEADAEQLDAFYDSDSASETEPAPRFSAPKSPASASSRADAKPAVDTADDVDPSAVPDGEAEEEKREEQEDGEAGGGTTEASEADALAPTGSALVKKHGEAGDGAA